MSAETLIGTSQVTRQLETEISDAASSDAKVLLTGESGVGKEVVARLIHQHSRRRNVKLVALNCAAVPDSLLESELFGHVRGSFTGAYRDKPGLLELANSGTIFLDEIGETSLRMQALMLRFLENGEIWRIGADRVQATTDVRVIAATNRELADRIAQREFRADLYYRLNVLHIKIPPLRERRDDIHLFLDHFLRAYSERHISPMPELTPAARAALLAYDWPGNVRELKNLIERLVVRRHTGAIDENDLPAEVLGCPASASSPAGCRRAQPRRRALRQHGRPGRVVLVGRAPVVHRAGHDPRRHPGNHLPGADANARQLSAGAAAVQHAGGGLQGVFEFPAQASVPYAVLPVPVPAADGRRRDYGAQRAGLLSPETRQRPPGLRERQAIRGTSGFQGRLCFFGLSTHPRTRSGFRGKPTKVRSGRSDRRGLNRCLAKSLGKTRQVRQQDART